MSHYALLIGVNTYPDETKLKPLNGPCADVQAFKQWLAIPPIGNEGVHIAEVTIGDSGNSQSTEAEYKKIYQALGDIRNRAKNESTRTSRPYAERLYIYFAGHGLFPEKLEGDPYNEAGFYPTDYNPNNFRVYVPLVNVVARLGLERYFRDIILFADSCRDSPDNKTGKASSLLDVNAAPDKVRSNALIGRAARQGFKAFEEDFGEPFRFRGVFSRAIMDGLQHLGRDETDGTLRAYTLKRYVQRRVKQLRTNKRPQSPDFSYDEDGDQIILTDKKATEISVKFHASDGEEIRAISLQGVRQAPVTGQATRFEFQDFCGARRVEVELADGSLLKASVLIDNPEGSEFDVRVENGKVRLTER